MGGLKNLNDNTVHLLLTNSDLAEIYVYDTLKARCKATLESIMTVNNSTSFKNMVELVNVQPNLADKWFFVIEYNKVKSLVKRSLGLFLSETSIFLVKVHTYKEFQEFKSLQISRINDLYLDVMNRESIDIIFHGYPLGEKLKSFIVTSYYRDPEKVFTLLNELKNGVEVKDSKDIVRIAGESTGTIQKLVLDMLHDTPKTKRFLSLTYKKRVQTVMELCNTFGISTTYNFILATLKDIINIVF